jgi:hypothetical protein
MPAMRAMVVVPAKTGLAADSVVNNWGLEASIDVGTWQAAFVAAMENLYDGWQTYMSSLYTWSAARIKLYNLEDPIPRVPIFDLPMGLTGSFPLNTLPQEVALCLSFQGPRVSGQNQARRRGRVYLGPWATAAGDSGTGRPEAAMVTAINDSANTFLAASIAATSWSWAVISTAAGGPAVAVPVENGWVDNSWDTQRRRGNSPGVRSVFPF